jgi:hypothetical protein
VGDSHEGGGGAYHDGDISVSKTHPGMPTPSMHAKLAHTGTSSVGRGT